MTVRSGYNFSLLDAVELEDLRSTMTSFLPETCDIQHMNWHVPDGKGGVTPTISSVTLAVPCRVNTWRTGRPTHDMMVGGQYDQRWRIIMDWAVNIEPKDRIVYQGLLLYVSGTDNPDAEPLFTSVWLSAVLPR